MAQRGPCGVMTWLLLGWLGIPLAAHAQPAWQRQQASTTDSPAFFQRMAGVDTNLTPPALLPQPASFNSQTNDEVVRELLQPLPNPAVGAGPADRPAPLAFSGWDDIPISFGAEWLTDAQTGLTTYDTSFKFPILKLFGTPPPIVKTGWAFTDLSAGPRFGLPRELYEYSVSVSQVYRLNDRWTVRSMLGVAMATDHRNRSSDAWQFRGGIFGIYQASEQWQWTVGAIALGRDDLPAVPALGAIWTPSPNIRWDLIPPDPKFNWMFSETASRQNWLYLGGGFDGTTWGYRTVTEENDRLTYGDLRVVAGWQSTPLGEPGVPYVRGRKYNVEIGYVFSRDLEFNQELTKISLDDAWLIRLETRY